MNARPLLDDYLSQARRRLRLILSAWGSALLIAALLVVTVVAAWMLPRYGFTARAALFGRIALFAAAAGVGVWTWLRWRTQERAQGAPALERALPEQSGRIATYLQESAKEPGKASILLDLLAADALAIAEREALSQRIRARRIIGPALAAVAGVAVFGLLFLGSGSFNEGARQLWTGRLPPAASVAAAAGGIAVNPGDATIRRNQDLPVSALVAGSADEVQLHVKFENGGEWEIAPMERRTDGGYDLTIYAVREGASYYVTAGRLKSAEHRITVVDLPTIESFKVRYDYPGWTGLPDREEESGGDVRAVAGTRVNLEVTTSAPLEGPLLVIDGDGDELDQSGATSRGGFAISKEGHYHIATRFLGEVVPLTPDYYIEVVEDQKPEVRIERPGRDYRATAIEEVPVRVSAKDDFRLDALELHYSVNGGEWRHEKLPADSPDIQAAALLRLEEMQQSGPGGEAPTLVPGDLVSYYAQARDHKHSVQTDLFLIQVQPFEQRFTQSQAGGGGGGGGGGGEEEGQISRRQREVLLATWNLQRNEKEGGEREKERVADNARMLAEVQRTLAEQARTLVDRTRARQLTGQDQNIDQFVKAVQEAAKAMEPAARNLADVDLQTAVTHEQQALQHLLRAESAFRDIEVAMQQNGGGGGGGGAQAGRDVSEMTELELDLAKNQYETEPQMSSQQRNQAEDEITRRLRELARRLEQQRLQAQRQQIPPEQQRWQQEQLRREIEQAQRELEQLAQQNSQQGGQQQNGQQQNGQQQGQQSSGQSGSQQQSASSQGGQRSASERQSQRAASAAEAQRQVAEAARQLQQAGDDPQALARATERLNRAREALERSRQQGNGEQFEQLADNARALARRQAQAEQELRAATGNRPPGSIARPGAREAENGMTYEQMDRMAAERREIQAQLEDLQRRMDSTRRAAQDDAPRAARQVAEARQELQQENVASGLSLSARQIERGQGRQAAGTEFRITDALERLAENLEGAAQIASTERGSGQQRGNEVTMEDLQAELANVQRQIERGREQSLAQNRTGGDPSTSAPNARDGQAGQQGGGEQGQQGQGGQGQQAGQQGSTPGQQGGGQAGADGGATDFGRGGIAGNRSGTNGRFISGNGTREPVPVIVPGLREQGVISAERLAQLREALRNTRVLSENDARALQELEQRLRRGNGDPMNAEYQRMAALVNQIELAALKTKQATEASDTTRATEVVDDSRQYRDNVAEYYRRLGGGNE